MIRSVVIAAAVVTMGACATDDGQRTSSAEQDVTTQTCTPTYDPAPPPKGGYLFCTVHAYDGNTYVVHSSEADCTACGVVLNHELCVENNYPSTLVYCSGNHGPGGAGGPGGGTSGDPCSAYGVNCSERADGTCVCPHLVPPPV